MRAFSSGNDSGKEATWYWVRGLHDAQIIQTTERVFDYDYTQRNPVRNCFEISLDASDALFDTGVQTIRLFNYKILRDDSSSGGYGDGLNGCYWMQDHLKWVNGHFVLEITALGEDDFSFVICFETAEVERNK